MVENKETFRAILEDLVQRDGTWAINVGTEVGAQPGETHKWISLGRAEMIRGTSLVRFFHGVMGFRMENYNENDLIDASLDAKVELGQDGWPYASCYPILGKLYVKGECVAG
jgi:hypothetical protein